MMASVTTEFTWRTGELNAFLRGPRGPVGLEMIRLGNTVLNAARRACPVDEGKLRASITAEPLNMTGDTMIVRVGSSLDYAVYVHEGTGIYGPKGAPIRARSGGLLRWPGINNSGSGNRRYSGGSTDGYIYARSVRGSPGRPFLRNALNAAR